MSSPLPPIRSLHHVTATVDGAQEDLDFAAGTLALRLVKQTVNFDNHHVYHFYYGDALGRPGSLWTTFPYRGWGVRPGTIGAGQVTRTAFAIPAGAGDAWRIRLARRGVAVTTTTDPFGAERLEVHDTSGLPLALVATDGDAREGWDGGGVPAVDAIRGLHGVTLTVHRVDATIAFLEQALGLRVVRQAGDCTRLAAGDDAPGHWVDVVHAPAAPRAVNGLGTVHHVAFCIDDGEAQRALRATLVERGVPVTEVRDREYFTSIYFREPGGVLLEVATAGPGFATDEPPEALGQALHLPAWEERNRAIIERGLPLVRPPG